MPRRIAHVFQVIVLTPGTNTALRRRGTGVVAHVVTEETVFELHHSGVSEQQRRIVTRHKRAGGNDFVSLRCEEVEERLADF